MRGCCLPRRSPGDNRTNAGRDGRRGGRKVPMRDETVFGVRILDTTQIHVEAQPLATSGGADFGEELGPGRASGRRANALNSAPTPVDLNFGTGELAFLNRVEDFFGENRKRGILKLWIIHIARDDLVVFSHSLNHHFLD